MITPSEWSTLLYLKPEDFAGKNPEVLRFSIVQKLDHFTGIIGSRPLILSAGRPGDPKSHGVGEAIDTTWPGQDPLSVNQKALESGLFKGIGIYVNELGAASHHFDDWDARTSIEPATWGGIITHPVDSSTNQHVRVTQYVTMQSVIEILKKKLWQAVTSPAALLLVGSLIIYLWRNRLH